MITSQAASSTQQPLNAADMKEVFSEASLALTGAWSYVAHTSMWGDQMPDRSQTNPFELQR